MPVETSPMTIAVQALAATGMSDTNIAATLQINRATAWRHKHKDLLDPELIAHATKTIADKMLLGATAAMDTFLDKAESNELRGCSPSALIKMSATAMDAARTYTASSGDRSFLGDTLSQYGVSTSHSVSRVTVERVTVDTKASASTPQPVVVSGIENT